MRDIIHAINYISLSLDTDCLSEISVFCAVLRTPLRKTIRLEPPVPLVFSTVPTPLSGQPMAGA